MKRISYIIIGLFMILLSGCVADCEVPDAPVPLLSVTVTAGGFSSGDGASTRAADAEYTTTFVKDDLIGIYAVSDDGVILDDNIAYSYDGTKWVPVDEEYTIHQYNYAGVTYFAYYPYSMQLHSATTEEGIITRFAPQGDQSTYAAYTASDLMTGAGVVTGAGTDSPTMKLTLEHRMSLITVDVKSNTYVTTDGYEYSEPVVCNSITVAGANMLQWGYRSSVSTYKYLIPPQTTACPVIINYNAGQADEAYNISLSIPKTVAGKYHLINTRRGNIVQRNLQIGDFYYQDGAILPKESVFYNLAANPCIGIVYVVGVGDHGNPADYDGKLSAIHGYVMALNHAYKTWGDGSQSLTGTAWFEYYGYHYSKKIMASAAVTGFSYPACTYCLNYTPAPMGISSGWYFPSLGQVSAFIGGNATVLDSSLGQVAGSNTISGDFYLSSSEENAANALMKKKNDGATYRVPKGRNTLTRAVLTF